jgi:hypothetical protein
MLAGAFPAFVEYVTVCTIISIPAFTFCTVGSLMTGSIIALVVGTIVHLLTLLSLESGIAFTFKCS